MATDNGMLKAAERNAETSNICTMNAWEDDTLDRLVRASMYLNSHYLFRRNAITERLEFAPMPNENIGKSGGETPFRILSKADKRDLLMEMAEKGLTGVTMTQLETAVDNSRAAGFNPITHYLDTLPAWDGEGHIEAFFSQFTDDAYEQTILHRAFLMTVGQMRNDGLYGNEICPVLISRTQGWGKSKSLRRLLPPELEVYFTDTLNLRREEECLRRMAAFLLINLDELDRYSPSDMARLKKLIQMKDMNLRKLYQNWMEALTRRASFWGTSNCRYVLHDPSGSRRFFPVLMKGCVDLDAPLDHAQLYAQAVHELNEKRFPLFFTAEENARIEEHNRSFNAQLALKALLEKHFEKVCYVDAYCAEATAKRLGLLTAQEVYDKVLAWDGELAGCFNERDFGQQLKALGYSAVRNEHHRYYGLCLRSLTNPVTPDEELLSGYAG